MAGGEHTTYIETLGEVRESLATLLERSENTNRRLDAIETKLDAVNALDQRITKVETKVNVGSVILGTLSLVGNAIAAWLGVRS